MASVNGQDSGEKDLLNGWKEIAAFLGRGVRTVQRWEQLYELPVRRLGREEGEIVFSSRTELARWPETSARRTKQKEPAPSTPVRDGATAAPLAITPDSRLSPSQTRRFFAPVLVLLAAVAVLIAFMRGKAISASEFADYSVVGGTLYLLDASGEEVQTVSLPMRLSDSQYTDHV